MTNILLFCHFVAVMNFGTSTGTPPSMVCSADFRACNHGASLHHPYPAQAATSGAHPSSLSHFTSFLLSIFRSSPSIKHFNLQFHSVNSILTATLPFPNRNITQSAKQPIIFMVRCIYFKGFHDDVYKSCFFYSINLLQTKGYEKGYIRTSSVICLYHVRAHMLSFTY